jgi:hypothetical protein
MITDHATDTATAAIEADGDTSVDEPEATPIAKMTKMHAEGLQASNDNMMALGQMLSQALLQMGQMFAEAQARPKTVTARSSGGQTIRSLRRLMSPRRQ